MHLMAIIAVSLLVSENQVIKRLILTFYKDGQTGAGKSYSMVCVCVCVCGALHGKKMVPHDRLTFIP